MSDPMQGHETPSEDPELDRALEALSPLEAQDDFRERLQARFVSGEFEQAPMRPEHVVATPRRAKSAARAPRSKRWPLWAGLAAASVAAFFLIRGPGSVGPSWEVLDASFGELVYVDGQQLSPEWETELEQALEEGGSVSTPAGTGLHLRLGQELAIFIGPESRVVLPEPPSESASTRFDFLTKSGHLSLATGPEFPGSTLQVFTPDTEVEVVGTSFAVDVDDKGTCVCCGHGTVRVRPLASAAGDDREVVAGHVGFVMPDGNYATQAETMPEHVTVLDALNTIW